LSIVFAKQQTAFWCFSESANSNNPYFATRAGAFKRLFMDGGVEPTDDGLKYNKGLLPKQWKSLKIIDLVQTIRQSPSRNRYLLLIAQLYSQCN
jgi:hypothetical protein